MAEKAYEKHAWILLFILGIVGLVFAFADMFSRQTDDPRAVRELTGTDWEEIVAKNPRLAALVLFWVRATGVALFGASILLLAIAGFGYRSGEKWTWYALWAIPATLLGFIANNFSGGGSLWPLFIVLLTVALLGLLLPMRKFFPRKKS